MFIMCVYIYVYICIYILSTVVMAIYFTISILYEYSHIFDLEPTSQPL